jgi:hypothetical protein
MAEVGMRRRLVEQGFGADRGFRWRGGEIQSFALNILAGLASIAIVTIGGPDAAFWSGMACMLIMPVQVVNGRLMRTRIRQAASSSPRP